MKRVQSTNLFGREVLGRKFPQVFKLLDNLSGILFVKGEGLFKFSNKFNAIEIWYMFSILLLIKIKCISDRHN